MDIVDVDEALKDDSFIFLEDKTHDDISNILQQWKTNNCVPPSTNTYHQPHQHQQEQAYKYDSRTFTRPKRKAAQNLELQFTTATQSSNQYQQNAISTQPDNPMFNLEIGGLVTNMQKSCLQDTSPPPFSSMDTSVEPMNNSLITSADFTNVNFLQSTNSLDFGGPETVGFSNFNLTGKVTCDGYSLSDMIRDRKALESLTMSSDGTLIKDSHIAQIDDISLTLSKTASGCSTMDNSTDSVEINNRTAVILSSDINQTYSGGVQLELDGHKLSSCNKGIESNNQNVHHQTVVLSDEMIGDITYNLVENSMYASLASEKAMSTTQCFKNENISKPASILNETTCLSTSSGGENCQSSAKTSNLTFDFHNDTSDTCSATPENSKNNIEAMKYYESTPHSSDACYSKHPYAVRLKLVNDEKISPIIATNKNETANTTRVIDDTFVIDQQNVNKTCSIDKNYTFSERISLMNNLEMIDDIENPTFDKAFKRLEQQSPASLEMKNVMDLAEAEANLLASNNNEEEFDHMLDEFSKVELNAEQLKMKKSLDSIKKRFNYGQNKDKLQLREISREAKDMRDMMRVSAELLGESDHISKDYLNMTIDILPQGKEELHKSKEHLEESLNTLSEVSSGAVKSPLKDSVITNSITDSKVSNGLSTSSASTGSNGAERLLSRRSRLYDDFNMSTLSSSPVHASKTSIGSSFTIHKEDNAVGDLRLNIENETEQLSEQNTLGMVQEKTEINSEGLLSSQISDNAKDTISVNQYRLAEKRERDRDRFKTIKITKNRNEDGTYGNGFLGSKLNVPCIDDYPTDKNIDVSVDTEHLNPRFSRRDQNDSPIFNNNKAEVDTNALYKATSKTNPNFYTYKKPKEKQSIIQNLPEIATDSTVASVESEVAASKPRSLSRPRYLSGLTKFSTVSKATSADELERSVQQHTNLNATTLAINSGIMKGTSAANVSLNRTQIIAPSEKKSGELKSPMGIKSKSFHNLSSHNTYTSAPNIAIGGGGLAARTFGLRKPSVTGISIEKLAKTNINRNSCLNTTSKQQATTQLVNKTDESVFKVPKPVSGIRAPGATTQSGMSAKRAGLVRPSSGYYSISATAKGVQQTISDADNEASRHSPTDSMSSASSKGSAQSLNKPVAVKSSCTTINSIAMKTNSTASLQKITIGSTGIPKPTGLRPPSNIKRSGLPRPSSFVKTDK